LVAVHQVPATELAIISLAEGRLLERRNVLGARLICTAFDSRG